MLLEELSGKDVVIFDDTEREVKSLEESLEKREIKYEFFKIDRTGSENQIELIQSVKLIFLDLSYSTSFGSQFDPEFCVQLISSVVPPNKPYYLVAWTKDPENTEAVVEILNLYNLSPISYITKEKKEYRISDDKYDIDRLFAELDKEFENIIEVDDFYGEIVDIEEDIILINCLIDKENSVFQIRRFDRVPFENYIIIKVGTYVNIRSTSKPGSRNFEFTQINDDLSHLFKKQELFTGLENSMFLTDKSED